LPKRIRARNKKKVMRLLPKKEVLPGQRAADITA